MVLVYGASYVVPWSMTTPAPPHVHQFKGAGSGSRSCRICGISSDVECLNGHPRTEANTRVNSKGKRKCLDCENQRERDRRASGTDPRSGSEAERARVAEYRAKLKARVFAHYGGKCACCGETEPIFLTIDHIDGNGAEHRKTRVGTGTAFYRWLVEHEFPPGFQALCFNCNFAKHVLGTCPHQTAP